MSRFRLRLTNLMVGMVFIGLVLALVAQQRAAERRERALKMALADRESKRLILDGMNRLLSDLGIDVLKQASDVELLQVSRGAGGRFIGAAHDVVTPTGVMLGEATARRLACVLLDYRNYRRDIEVDDFPAPRFGLRMRGSTATLDVLIETSLGSSHQDVWIRIQNQAGKTLHSSAGWKCMNDPELQKLGESILSR